MILIAIYISGYPFWWYNRTSKFEVTRYPEDIDALIKAFKKERVERYLKKTKELIKWLKKDKRLTMQKTAEEYVFVPLLREVEK